MTERISEDQPGGPAVAKYSVAEMNFIMLKMDLWKLLARSALGAEEKQSVLAMVLADFTGYDKTAQLANATVALVHAGLHPDDPLLKQIVDKLA